jgi:SAM-dependent methyltransferase
MNWKLKALAQSALSRLPYASTINYWGQKFITRAHQNPGVVVADRLERSRWFMRQFSRHGGVKPDGAHFFEFGAGWDLAGPLAMYCLGASRQCVLDIERCAHVELVNGVIGELNRREAELPRTPGAPIRALQELKPRFGIDYRAPADARATELPAASVDCITSTFTMEHIPAPDLKAILAESRRILKPGGLILSLIDYQDHYSYRDPSISVYNFLQYDERQWRRFNPPLHYQNRMRHSQYRRMFAEAGFEILDEELKRPSAEDLACVASLEHARCFQEFDREDLAIRGSAMVCRVMACKAAVGPEALCTKAETAPSGKLAV